MGVLNECTLLKARCVADPFNEKDGFEFAYKSEGPWHDDDRIEFQVDHHGVGYTNQWDDRSPATNGNPKTLEDIEANEIIETTEGGYWTRLFWTDYSQGSPPNTANATSNLVWADKGGYAEVDLSVDDMEVANSLPTVDLTVSPSNMPANDYKYKVYVYNDVTEEWTNILTGDITGDTAKVHTGVVCAAGQPDDDDMWTFKVEIYHEDRADVILASATATGELALGIG